jgi:pimeloyl-ACP methyl ester carboxylesterase
MSERGGQDPDGGVISLGDGRRLAFAQYGPPAGTPLVFVQGTPSSRLMHPPEEIIRESGVLCVTIDRPGFGGSDPLPGRTLLGWVDDLVAVLDHLRISRFHILGISGGCPFTLAAAYALADRVRAAGVCGGSGPLELPGALQGAAPVRRAGYLLARQWPALFRWILRHPMRPSPDAREFAKSYTRHNPPADQAILADPAFHDMFVANFAEALRQGPDAFAEEVILGSRPWGFDLREISVPVCFWHGDADNSTPLGMARGMAERIPKARLSVLPGQGHLFVYSPLCRPILRELLAA